MNLELKKIIEIDEYEQGFEHLNKVKIIS